MDPIVNPSGQAVNDLGPTPAPAPAASPTPSPTPSPDNPPAVDPPAAITSSLTDAPKAPEAAAAPVEFKLEEVTLPEGMTIPEDLAPKLTEVAKETGLTAAQLSALAPFHDQIVKQVAESNIKAYQETNDRWIEEVKADPEIGGAKLDGVIKNIGKVIDQYGSPELRQALAYTGAGNNPHIVRFMAKVAAQLTEGGPTRTGTPTGADGKPTGPSANAMYPNLPG